jgi:hypothetical protein
LSLGFDHAFRAFRLAKADDTVAIEHFVGALTPDGRMNSI